VQALTPSSPDATNASSTPPSTGPLRTRPRVLDLTWAIAGPLATRLLADSGADILRIDAPWAPAPTGFAASLASGKRRLRLDLRTVAGRALLAQLIAASDVLVENFSPRVLDNWGLDHSRLATLNPRLVVVQLSGFGRTGPWRDHVAFAPTLHALCGHTLLTAPAAGRVTPRGLGYPYADVLAGCVAALATLSGLDQCRRTGVGCTIDLSQYEILTWALGPVLTQALAGRGPTRPTGNQSQEGPAAPHGVYRAADGPTGQHWVAIAVFGAREWRRFRAALGTPSWTGGARFATRATRREHATALDQAVASWTRRRPAAQIVRTLQRAGVAAAVVAPPPPLDHAAARVAPWLPGDDDAGHHDHPVAAAAARAPADETAAILATVLGLTPTAVEQLRDAGAFGDGGGGDQPAATTDTN
jgi:crotonobetainyl-CoA:carnitine CoA-transferase CaiB-like acyl-CoA transferase